MLKTGVCGWMCDFGESVPLNFKPMASKGDNLPLRGKNFGLKIDDFPGDQYHSLYPAMWADVNMRAIRETKQILDNDDTLCNSEDVTFFMRSATTVSPGSSLGFWLGDQMVLWDSFDGLGSAVIGMLTGGLSGFTSTHSDIGGYTAIEQTPFKLVRQR